MSNKAKKRRRRNRQRKSNSTPVAKLLRENFQKDGAFGTVALVAHLAGLALAVAEEEPAASCDGFAFTNVFATERTKLAAGALAAVAEVWPDSETRDHAHQLLAGRTKQLSGVLRKLSETEVSSIWRLTDEYRDAQVLLLEMSAGDVHVATVSVVTDEFRPRVEINLLRARASEAAEYFDMRSDAPGGPRRILESVDREDARFDVWMLTARRRHFAGEPSAHAMFGWATRLLEVEFEFPDMPSFDRHSTDEGPHVDEVFDAFLRSDAGRPWDGWEFAELVEHLRWFESGRPALHWSPARVEHFLLHTSHELDEGDPYALPALLRGWVTACASATRQRKPLLRAVLAEIDRCEPKFFTDAA